MEKSGGSRHCLTSLVNLSPFGQEYANVKTFSDGLSGGGHFYERRRSSIGQGRGSIAQGIWQPHGSAAGNAAGDLGLGAAQ
jgi:hypothetical protein